MSLFSTKMGLNHTIRYMSFIPCSVGANLRMAPPWPFPKVHRSATQEKNKWQKGWHFVAKQSCWESEFPSLAINQLWSQTMLSFWGMVTWGQKQQAQKHWDEMELKMLCVPSLPGIASEEITRKTKVISLTLTLQQLGEHYLTAPFYIKTIPKVSYSISGMFSLQKGEGTFKVCENQSWQLSKHLLIVLCAMQNVEELIPALYQEGELGEGGKAGTRERPERSGSRKKQELASDTVQFVSHQTLNLRAIWSEQQVEDFKQLHLEQDGQCSKKQKANRQGEWWSASLQRLLTEAMEQVDFSTTPTEGLEWFIDSLDNEQSGRKKEI